MNISLKPSSFPDHMSLPSDWHRQVDLPIILSHPHHQSEGDCTTGRLSSCLVPCTVIFPYLSGVYSTRYWAWGLTDHNLFEQTSWKELDQSHVRMMGKVPLGMGLEFLISQSLGF